MASGTIEKFTMFKKALTSSDDLDAICNQSDSGFYQVGLNVQNSPINYASLIVIGGAPCIQLLFQSGSSTATIYMRTRTGSPLTWYQWYKISLSPST